MNTSFLSFDWVCSLVSDCAISVVSCCSCRFWSHLNQKILAIVRSKSSLKIYCLSLSLCLCIIWRTYNQRCHKLNFFSYFIFSLLFLTFLQFCNIQLSWCCCRGVHSILPFVTIQVNSCREVDNIWSASYNLPTYSIIGIRYGFHHHVFQCCEHHSFLL
jgi:hypothetical protein